MGRWFNPPCRSPSGKRMSNNDRSCWMVERRYRFIAIATGLILGLFITLTILHFHHHGSAKLSAVRQFYSPSICNGYSPLYVDAKRTHKYYLDRGGIHLDDLASSKAHCDAHGQCLQVKLYDMNLYVGNVSDNPHCYETRGESLLMNLNLAVEQARQEGQKLPNFDVYMMCQDRPDGGNHGMWYISKTIDHANAIHPEPNFFLMPDFNFYSWPEAFNEPWSRAHQHIKAAGQAVNFAQKDSRMFWRGVIWTSPDRQQLMEKTRGHEDVADIVAIEWKSPDDPAPSAFVSGTDMCAWRYIIYTEGISYSGRLKYNMLCSSVILGPTPYWVEFWTHLIVSGHNYVAVDRDWANLLSTHAQLESDPRGTAEIARNAQRTMDYLDTRGVSCYFRELIRLYADVCHWTVEEPDMGPPRERRKAGTDWMSVEDYFLAIWKH